MIQRPWKVSAAVGLPVPSHKRHFPSQKGANLTTRFPKSLALGCLAQGRLLMLPAPNEVMLLSADNRIDREHPRANEQNGERDHHKQV